MYREKLLKKEVVDRDGNNWFVENVEDSNELKEVVIKLDNDKRYNLYVAFKSGFIRFLDNDINDEFNKFIEDEKIELERLIKMEEEYRRLRFEELEKEKELNKDAIRKFREDYYFLSNFYKCKVTYNGITYENSEAAFQAQKDLSRSEEFASLCPGKAKKLGKQVNLRKDWEKVKIGIMYDLLKCKFDQNPELKEKLLETGDRLLIESNNHHDTFWGVCKEKGQNNLGKLLMRLRKSYRE